MVRCSWLITRAYPPASPCHAGAVITSGLVNLHTADIGAGTRSWGELLGLGTADAALRGHDVGNDNHSALLRDPDGNLVEILSKQR
ncbi:hypothetical protein G5V58_17565 [Nocardioides anomalus]|uniref:VOC family protein n=1 Tax=Nocardioides anomalus TaxID=2712223 RepID=A0A6G6WGI4_9ACTN|nr:hypothetical protein [Nocardioides anomalus]QIG44344.1 hypothetical protein G5V58_17565 [Nocardioides anomalus]